MQRTAKETQELLDLASSLLFQAKLALPGSNDAATAAQWGLASVRFKARTGLTLTEFYASIDL